MQIRVNEQNIEQVKETVFLGVVLDEHLTWKPHISQVAHKQDFFYVNPKNSLLLFSLSFFYLHYCISHCPGIYVQNQSSSSCLFAKASYQNYF